VGRRTAGSGQQGGKTMSEINDPEWPEIIRAVQDQLQDRIHTSCPGIVKSYDNATQTAKVQLAVQLKGVNGEMTTVPVLEDVPVCWQGGAAGHLHVPLTAGDTVMVVFGESDFGGWWETGSVSSPKSLARHDLNAVAIPGCRRAAEPLDVTGGHVTLAATSALHLGSDGATKAVALEPDVAAVLGDLVQELLTLAAALVPGTGVAAPAQAAFAANAAAIAVRIAAGEMAATKVKGV
jgi:hypothetical protein